MKDQESVIHVKGSFFLDSVEENNPSGKAERLEENNNIVSTEKRKGSVEELKYSECALFEVKKFILDYFTEFKSRSDSESMELISNKRGRPRSFKGTSYLNLHQLILKHLCKNLSLNGRSDSKQVTMKRKISKIPGVLLAYISSQTHIKSSDLKLNLRAYLESFCFCFLPLFDRENQIDASDYFNYFLDYIILSFPDKRVMILLEMLKRNADISGSEFDNLSSALRSIRGTSIETFKLLKESNRCISLMVSKLSSMVANKPAVVKLLKLLLKGSK